ncbi:hypothetical protein D3C78_392420 [compost metagenome]
MSRKRRTGADLRVTIREARARSPLSSWGCGRSGSALSASMASSPATMVCSTQSLPKLLTRAPTRVEATIKAKEPHSLTLP